MQVLQSVPIYGSAGVFLDDSIVLTFDAEVEASYFSTDFFKLYRTDENMSTFYELCNVTVSASGAVVTVDPTLNLTPESYYVLIVIGGTSGVQSVTGDTLAANHVLFFKAGSVVRPVAPDVTVITETDLYPSGYTSEQTGVSTDLFSTSGEMASISLIRTVPAHGAVGIRSTLNTLIFIYNDDIDPGQPVPANAMEGTYKVLPYDPDPFADRSIVPSGMPGVSHNQLIFSGLVLGDTTNREYTFRLSPGIVKGVSRQRFDYDAHVVKMLGPLTPLYALPDQVRARLTAWSEDARLDISDYELYKLIHEVSSYLADTSAAAVSASSSLAVNRAVICMVLMEIGVMGRLLVGGIKARDLLATSVQYYDAKVSDLLTHLKECVSDALSASGLSSTVLTGIKSARWLNRETKLYGVYR